MTDRLTQWLTQLLTAWLTQWQRDCQWQSDWRHDWHSGRVTDFMTDRMTEWLTELLTAWLTQWHRDCQWQSDWWRDRVIASGRVTNGMTDRVTDEVTEWCFSVQQWHWGFYSASFLLIYCSGWRGANTLCSTADVSYSAYVHNIACNLLSVTVLDLYSLVSVLCCWYFALRAGYSQC